MVMRFHRKKIIAKQKLKNKKKKAREIHEN